VVAEESYRKSERISELTKEIAHVAQHEVLGSGGFVGAENVKHNIDLFPNETLCHQASI